MGDKKNKALVRKLLRKALFPKNKAEEESKRGDIISNNNLLDGDLVTKKENDGLIIKKVK